MAILHLQGSLSTTGARNFKKLVVYAKVKFRETTSIRGNGGTRSRDIHSFPEEVDNMCKFRITDATTDWVENFAETFKNYSLYVSGSSKFRRQKGSFCMSMQQWNEDDFFNRLIFSDESTFQLSGKVNKHNVRTWGTESPG